MERLDYLGEAAELRELPGSLGLGTLLHVGRDVFDDQKFGY